MCVVYSRLSAAAQWQIWPVPPPGRKRKRRSTCLGTGPRNN